ncbi:MAG TPA: hypothetical protein VF395_17605 [Polyangiaceae bacterium]
MIRIGLAFGVSVLLLATTGRAEPTAAAPRAPSPGATVQGVGAPESPFALGDGCVDIAAQLGLPSASEPYNSASLEAGLAIGLRLLPALRVGAYLDSLEYLYLGGDGKPDFTLIRFGARAEGHARPDRVVDPWLGVAVGALHGNTFAHQQGPGESRWAMDVEGDLGLDFHVDEHVAVGPVVSVIQPLADQHSGIVPPFPTSYAIPLPSVRLTITL